MHDCRLKRIIIIVAVFLAVAVEAYAQSAIYACGHIRRQREKAISALRPSGYTTVIIFNVNVEADGTLTTDFDWGNQRPAEAGGIICRDGQYVFGQYQPHFADDVKALLEAPTTVSRIEICIGGWGNGSYGNIKKLVESTGTGAETALYRNFKALKEAIPQVVAVNNDQEQDYDVASAVSFHRMLATIGYKTTVAPYMYKDYWRQLVASLNEAEGTCDLIYLQTYGGGAGNNPADWQVFGNVPMYVGYDCEASADLNAMVDKFEGWRDNAHVAGGFLWNYNSEARNVNEWATAVNRVFAEPGDAEAVATVYQNANYTGYAVELPEGAFNNIDMALRGIRAKDLASVQVKDGYSITLYTGNDFDGQSITFEEATPYLGLAWIKRACSIKVQPAGGSGIGTVGCEGKGIAKIYNMAGMELPGGSREDLEKLPAGTYIVITDGVATKVLKY